MNFVLIIFIVYLLFLAFDAINNTETIINDFKNVLGDDVTLPPGIEGLPIPSIENATKLFQEKCIKQSGSNAAYEEASVRLV